MKSDCSEESDPRGPVKPGALYAIKAQGEPSSTHDAGAHTSDEEAENHLALSCARTAAGGRQVALPPPAMLSRVPRSPAFQAELQRTPELGVQAKDSRRVKNLGPPGTLAPQGRLS